MPIFKGLHRWRLDLSYDGSGFHVWAAQTGLRTVQGELENWIGLVLRLPEPARLTVAGRTDAGVHARAQVAHLDLAPQFDATQLANRLARVLPDDVVVHTVIRAPASFDARSLYFLLIGGVPHIPKHDAWYMKNRFHSIHDLGLITSETVHHDIRAQRGITVVAVFKVFFKIFL